jgi:hypothetical protein
MTGTRPTSSFPGPALATGTSEQCIEACSKDTACGGFTRPAGTADTDAGATCSWYPMSATDPSLTTHNPPQLFMETIQPDTSTNFWRKQPHAYPTDGIGQPWQRINPRLVSERGGPRGCGKYLPLPEGYVAARSQNLGGGTKHAGWGNGTVKECAAMCNANPACVGFRRGNSRDDDESATCVWASGTPTNVPFDAFDMFYKSKLAV